MHKSMTIYFFDSVVHFFVSNLSWGFLKEEIEKRETLTMNDR